MGPVQVLLINGHFPIWFLRCVSDPFLVIAVFENGSNDHYVINAWFFANAVKPRWVPVADWQAGYDPGR
jgi:predicted FMN-binding regulatory protein PaiB